jgi:hypothetical protein
MVPGMTERERKATAARQQELLSEVVAEASRDSPAPALARALGRERRTAPLNVHPNVLALAFSVESRVSRLRLASSIARQQSSS